MAGYYFEVLETVERPDAIYEGKSGEYIAVRDVEKGIIHRGSIQGSEQRGWIYYHCLFDKAKKAA